MQCRHWVQTVQTDHTSIHTGIYLYNQGNKVTNYMFKKYNFAITLYCLGKQPKRQMADDIKQWMWAAAAAMSSVGPFGEAVCLHFIVVQNST